MSYELERMTAVHAVLKACNLCQSVQQALVSEDTAAKQDRSPVTVADFGAQAVVIHLLKASFPNDPIVAEEDASELAKAENAGLKRRVLEHVGAILPGLEEARVMDAIGAGGHAGGKSNRFWTLDPIDGTKGFLRREQYAAALALVVDGEVKLGVLGCPNLPPFGKGRERGRLLIAVRGEGAFERGFETDPTEWKIGVDRLSDPAQAVFCESVEAAHSSHSASAQIAARLKVSAPAVRMDSQCKYAVVARGEASIYLRLPSKKPTPTDRYIERIWDHAAGSLIVEEAGGKVTDIHGKALDYSLGRGLENNTGVIVTNGLIHEQVLRAVREVLV